MTNSPVAPSEFKVYWFARDLVASSHGSYATKEARTLRELSETLERDFDEKDLTDGVTLEREKDMISDTITGAVDPIYAGDVSKRYRQTEDLAERITRRIEDEWDVRELRIAIDAVVRTSEILDTTPSFGADDIARIVDETIEEGDGRLRPDLAYDALYNVDFEGEEYQLGAQRAPLTDYVHEELESLRGSPEFDDEDVARIVSSIVQEYERRAGQSRASTAGNVLETALQHLFDRFGIPATGEPEHFGDIEIDNLVDGPEASIGFSCKRTLRERFRQSLTREAEIGVDEVWFVSLLMADVSREKIRDIHDDGSRIYVPRDSFVWNRYSGVDEFEYTLRPADEFIDDVVEFTGVDTVL